VSDKHVGTQQTDVKQVNEMVFLGLVEAGYHVEDFFEAVIHQTVGLLHEVFVPDKNLVVAVDEGDAIGQLVLNLTAKVRADSSIDPATEDV